MQPTNAISRDATVSKSVAATAALHAVSHPASLGQLFMRAIRLTPPLAGRARVSPEAWALEGGVFSFFLSFPLIIASANARCLISRFFAQWFLCA